MTHLMLTAKEQLFVQFEQIAWQQVTEGIRRKVMAYGDQLMAVHVEFKKGAVGSLHSHPHVQLTNVQSGSFQVQIGSEIRTLAAGDYFYVPSGVTHGAVALEDGVLLDMFSPMRADFVPTAK
jgi:quercetin dioxygenase-like cupin family protein